MALVAWMILLALLVNFFSGYLDRQQNPNEALVSRTTEDGTREVVLDRNRQGHYVTPGQINGHDVVFLLDTGATGVAIPSHLARVLDLPHGRPIQTQTANGTTTSYLTTLEEVSVGPIRQFGVQATVNPGLQMDQVLLGMSFLKNLELIQRDNQLTLRQ